MTGLVLKLIVCPIIVFIADILLAQIYYPALYQPILVGLLVAVAGHVMEVFILKKGTLWLSNLADFAAATVIIYASPLFLPGARITLLGALFTAFLLNITEYVQHLYLIQSGKTKK